MGYHHFYFKDGTAGRRANAAETEAAAAMAKEDREQDEGLDLDRDEPLIERWRHLATGSSRVRNNASGEQAWWMVVCGSAVLRAKPSPEAEVLARLERGDPIYCVHSTDAWIRCRPNKRPAQMDPATPVLTWHAKVKLPNNGPVEAWVMWTGEEKGSGTKLMPVNHLVKLLQYRNTNVELPREAVTWTLSEVDVFLGSVGFVRPGRESAMMRSSKRLVRAVRGGAMGLEFRVDEQGKSGGVFASGSVEKGAWVEVCPLLEVDLKLRMKSEMLQRITLRMVGEKIRYGIVLGFGKVYSVSKTPNLHWSYRGEDEVVLWAAEEIHEGRELSVDFTAPPMALEQALKQPPTWQAPVVRGPGKLQNAGYVVHGNSGIHGRGVFTTRDAVAGELLECCPALVLDEAGAEAMFSYRWGLAHEESSFFLPLGLGSLYNHSEKPTAKGTLDVRRKVLEFYTTADMYKGQEVLVSYGDTYFDEDFEGHRKSELLHIESPDGSLELQKLIELQRALIRAFTSEDFLQEVRARASERQKLVSAGSMIDKAQVGKTKSVHALFMETEQPILERFGYNKGMQGAMQMQEDLTRCSRGLDPSHEAVRNNAFLGTLAHMYDPPPVEYWETVPVELVILGTEGDEHPEVLRADVPKTAPSGFVRFMLSVRFFPEDGAYLDGRVRLVGGGGSAPYAPFKDCDPLPPADGPQGRRVLVSGVSDVWPARQKPRRPDGSEDEELTDWQIIWRWLMDPYAQQLANNFRGGSYKIAGTWDDFKGNEMQFDGRAFVHWVAMSEQRWESFQILRDGRWETTLYPDVRDGSLWVPHKLKGPDNKGHGKNWTMGRHADDAGEPGTWYKIELRPDERGLPGSVHWTRFSDKGEAAAARQASKGAVDWALSQTTWEEISAAKARERDVEDLRLEGARRQEARRAPAEEPLVEVQEPESPAKEVQERLVEVQEPARPSEESGLPFDFDALSEAEEAA